MALNDISLSISGDPSGAVNALRQTESAARQTADTVTGASGRMAAGMREAEASTGRMGQSMKDLQQLMAQFGAGFSLAMVIKQSLEAALSMERINAAMKATMGSGQAAARELQFIREESNRLGLEFQSTALAFAKFSASTKNTAVEGEATRKIFIGVSEAVTAMKLTGDEANGIFLALSQMMSKGKVSAEELNGQLGERLPGALKLTADAMGLTTAELMKQMQAGKLMSADVLPKLAEQLHKTYGAAAVEAANQGQGSINKFKNELFETAAALGNALMPALQGIINVMTPAMTTLREFIAGLQIVAVRTAAYVDRKGATAFGTVSQEEQKRRLAIIDQAEQAAIDDIMKKAMGTSSQKSAAELAAENAKVAAAKRREAASASAASSSADQTAEYNKYVSAYNRMIDAIREGDPTLTAEEKAVQRLKDQYENLYLEFPKHKTELEGLYATHLKQVESLNELKKAVSDTSIEFKALQQVWDNQPAENGTSGQFNIANEEMLKLIDTLNGTAALDDFNEKMRKMNAIMEEAPERAASIREAMDALKISFDSSSGLSSLRDENSTMQIDMIEDQFRRQQAILDAEYASKKAHYERELKLASTTAEKKAELEKALSLEKQKYDKDSAKNADASFKSQLSMVANYAGIAGDLFSKLADSQDQSSRDGFEAAKKYATAAAVMNTAAAIMNAMATSSNIYVGIAMAALAAATGAIQIAKIQSTTFGGGDTSVTAPSGTVSGAGTSSGGVAGSAIGTRYVSIQDSQTTEALQSLADSADNASLAIGKIVDGFSKIASMFSDGGYASMFMGNAPGISRAIGGTGTMPITLQDMLVNGSLLTPTAGFELMGNLMFGIGNKFAYKGSTMMLGGTSSSVSVADVDEYRRKGGLFGGGKTKYDIKYDAEWSDFMQGLVTTIGTSVQRMAITLGTKANTDGVALPGTVILTTGRTADAIAEDVQKWLEDVGASLAGTIPELEKFAFAGENYYLALTRLNDALVSTNQRLQEIGATLIDSTLAGANAAYKLQDLMGGSEAFSEAMDTYFTSIFTESEQKAAKLATAQRLVNNAFAEMGATGITTRAQFKALVNSLDLTTEFGAKTFAALMDVSEAFGTVTEEAEKAAQTLLTTLTDTALAAAQALQDIMGGPLSTKSPTQIYEEQRKAFADALAAGRTAELPELGKALLEASRNYNASGAGYVSDYQMVTDALMSLAGLSGTPTIDKVQAQINILTDIRDNLETQNQAQLAALSGMLGTSSPLYVALRSYLQQAATASTTTDSVLNAMKIADINKQISTTQASLATAAIARDAAAASVTSGGQYAMNAVLGGFWSMSYAMNYVHGLEAASATAVQQWQALQDQLTGLQAQLAALQTIPGHAMGGVASGWSWVGENGKELVNFTNPARVYTAEQSRAMIGGVTADNSDVVAELKSLREEVRAVVRVNQAGYSTLIEQGTVSNSNTGEIAGKIRLAEAA